MARSRALETLMAKTLESVATLHIGSLTSSGSLYSVDDFVGQLDGGDWLFAAAVDHLR